MRNVTMMQSQWKADTQSGESLRFKLCKGGQFSTDDEYGLKVVGKTLQDGTPTPDAPIPIQCVKAGTKILCCGRNFLNPTSVEDYKTYVGIKSTTVEADIEVLRGKKINAVIAAPSGGLVRGRWYIYSEDGTTLESFVDSSPGGTSCITNDLSTYYTLPNNAKRLVFTVLDALYGECTASLYTSDDKLNYDVYIGNEITVPCDIYEGDVWYPTSGRVEVNTGSALLKNVFAYYQGTGVQQITILKEHPAKTGTQPIVSPYSTSKTNTAQGVNMDKGVYISGTNRVYWRYALRDTGMTLEEFNAWLDEINASEKPFVLYYPLATPMIKQYDPQPIFAPSGTVNVSQTPVDLSAGLSATMLTRR